MVWHRFLAAFVSLLFLPLGAVAASSGDRILVQVRETSGASLGNWPVTFGVPFPKGTGRDAGLRLSLAGQPLPVQSRVMSRWPDGSRRWVLVDTQVDLKPQQITELRVEEGMASATRPALQVRESPDAIVVDTGALRFRVAKRGAGLIHDIEREGQPVTRGPLACFLQISGERHPCGPPTSVRVLESGSLRTRIELRGVHGPDIRYVVRIDAYAGQPFLRVFHTFANHGARPLVEIDEIGLELPLRFDAGAAYRIGIESKAALAGTLPASGLRITQLDEAGYRLGSTTQAGRVSGWASLHSDDRGVAVSGRSFWQEYPSGIELRRDRLTYHLWAPGTGPARVGSGAAKTHEVVFYFAGAAPPTPALLSALGAATLGHVAADYTAGSRALRNAIAPGPDTKVFLRQLDDSFRRYRAHADRERWDDRGVATCTSASVLSEKPRRGFYGMWNWGDWNYPGYHDTTKGCDAWGNLEYDLTQVLALGYAATGQPHYADGMIAAARHFMDVDTIHESGLRPQWTGMNHPKNPLHFTFELGGIDLGHTWNEGLLTYAFLTGDERGLEVARGIADHLVARLRRGVGKGNPRQWGWPQVALVAMYEATGEMAYRDAAIGYAMGGMAAHPPEPILHWKTGILAESLAYTHSITAPGPASEKMQDWLRRYAAAVLAYSSSPDPRFAPALAYVGRIEGQAKYRDAARRSVDRLSFGQWGKPLTIAGRTGFSVLGSATR